MAKERFRTPEFRRLFILAEIGNLSPDEYQQYQQSMIDMSDYYNIIDTAAEKAEKRGMAKGLEQGLAQGREEGRVEGREEGRVEIVKKMGAKGMSPEDISSITDIPIEEVGSILGK